MKEDEGTLAAKLRNALGPHYGLASSILRVEDHPKMKTIVIDMANQAIKNNLLIDDLLKQIDSICDQQTEIVYRKVEKDCMTCLGFDERQCFNCKGTKKYTSYEPITIPIKSKEAKLFGDDESIRAFVEVHLENEQHRGRRGHVLSGHRSGMIEGAKLMRDAINATISICQQHINTK